MRYETGTRLRRVTRGREFHLEGLDTYVVVGQVDNGFIAQRPQREEGMGWILLSEEPAIAEEAIAIGLITEEEARERRFWYYRNDTDMFELAGSTIQWIE